MKTIDEIAEQLARALGHKVGCPQIIVACTCEESHNQAEALDEYQHWKENKGVKNENK